MTYTTRRNFLKVSALAGGGLMMSIALPGTSIGSNSEASTNNAQFNNFLTIDREGRITFTLTKHEMGQGSGTGLPMILADELGADWSKLKIVRSDYDKKFNSNDMGTTGGSGTISKMWDVLRNAGATAREMLKQAAANQWNVEVSSLDVDDNYVLNKENGDRLEFGEIAAEAAKLEVPMEVQLKDRSEYKYIGTSVRNAITEDVIAGRANYGINVDIPEMLYASIEKSPAYKGKLKSFDDSAAREVNGVIDIFPIPQLTGVVEGHHVQAGVVVVASSTWAALKARKALKIEWDSGALAGADNEVLKKKFDEAEENALETVYEKGDVVSLQTKPGYELVESVYENPYQAHALMEPINATAHYTGDTCEVWVGTQSGERISREVAKVTDLPEESITVHVLNSGGSFGRRFYADSSMEAAYISKQLKKPVKLTWSREDEISHDYFHPYQRSIHKAIIDPDKKVVGWEHAMVRTEDYYIGDQKWEIPYDFENIRTKVSFIEGPVHTGAWRSVGEHSSSLGKESFIDELAHKLEQDPLEFRLSLLREEIKLEGNDDFAQRVFNYRKLLRERYLAVLHKVQSAGLWSRSSSPGKGRGLAIENFGRTICAHIAEVSIQDSRHGFNVDKVTSVVHCGTVVNPHFGKGQIEGSIIYALSALKYGGIEVNRGSVQRSNFHDNELLRMDEVPTMEVHFIESDDPPSGLGEPGTPPLAPAVLNAIFDATGQRIRKIPVLKEDLKKTVDTIS